MITLPIIAPALVSGWLLAFTISLDDLVIASFARAGLEHAADGDLLQGASRREPGHQRAGDDHGPLVTVGVIIAGILWRGRERRQRDMQMAAGRSDAEVGRCRTHRSHESRSKLPHVGTTIFTVMTNRARELGAINLAQGFPDYDAPAKLKDLVAYHVAAGHNQYAPMIGVAELREQIALKLGASYGRLLDSESEITITLGATEGIFSADARRSCIRATKSSCSILRTTPTRRRCCSQAAGRSTFRSSRRGFTSTGSACDSRCRRARGW